MQPLIKLQSKCDFKLDKQSKFRQPFDKIVFGTEQVFEKVAFENCGHFAVARCDFHLISVGIFPLNRWELTN